MNIDTYDRHMGLRRRVNAFERTNTPTSRQGLRRSRLCIYVYKTLRFAAAKNTEYPVSSSRINAQYFRVARTACFCAGQWGIATNDDVLFPNVPADVGGGEMR